MTDYTQKAERDALLRYRTGPNTDWNPIVDDLEAVIEACDALHLQKIEWMEKTAKFSKELDKLSANIETLERERDEVRETWNVNRSKNILLLERIEALEKALNALCDKLDVIVASPEYQGQASMAHVHGYVYSGPTWIEELLAARAALEAKL